ncbi:MAG: DUF1015 domain-containing protein [Oligosphaeraceae bacterium]|nr:DUF1015 domain-containing protein [Oligosphaeraceae bacterium]
MANVYPFAAWLAAGDVAPSVSSLPYDVMNRAEAKEMAAGNPNSFLRVTRSEIELPEDLSPYSPEVYQRAAENWQKLCSGVLQQDPQASYYIYSLVWKGRRQTGVVAAASVADYDQGIIRKHERTRKEKEDDRTRHISTLRAQTGPVFLTYRDSEEVNAVVMATMNGQPLFDFLASDGIRHSGWQVPQKFTPALQAAFAAIPRLYIADGHHRAASASRTRAALAEQGPVGQADKFLSVIFPAGQLAILPYNRVMQDLNGLSCQEFLQALKGVCTVTATDQPIPAHPGQVCLYCQKKWYRLDFSAADAAATAIDRLDVSLLQSKIIAPILGISDPRTDPRIDFIGGIRGTDELQKRVDSGAAALAFSMHPTTVEQLMEIADANEIMPPKSTWFEPKLRDGLFVHAI